MVMDARSFRPTHVWSQEQRRAVVRDYFAALKIALRGTARPRAPAANGRSSGLADFRDDEIHAAYSQITGILIEHGLLFLNDSRPLVHYPVALAEEVRRFVRNHPDLLRLMGEHVDSPIQTAPTTGNRPLHALMSSPPTVEDMPGLCRPARGLPPMTGIDYLDREQHNPSLRLSGELFALAFERKRLHEAGLESHARLVEHVTAERGEGIGYDLHSYEEDGSDRYIKVKATRFRRETPFSVSAREIDVSSVVADRYHLYRVFDLVDRPRLYIVAGALQDHYELSPSTFRARPR